MNPKTQAQPTREDVREQQRRSWNDFAPGWRKWDEFTMEFLRPAGDAILKEARLRPGMHVLDAACGTGEPGLTAARAVAPTGTVTGTDLSEQMIETAAAKAGSMRVPNYRAQAAEAEALPFEDGRFDAVLCRMGVMFFPNPAQAAREFHRVLKPGGAVALCAWAEREKNPWATTIADIVNGELSVPPPPPDAPGLFRQAQPGTLKRLLESAGFSQAQEYEITSETEYESAEKYWEMFNEIAAPIVGPLSRADEATRSKIRDKVIRAAGKFARGGKLAFPWSAWVAHGVRA